MRYSLNFEVSKTWLHENGQNFHEGEAGLDELTVKLYRKVANGEDKVERLLECNKIPNAEKYSKEEMIELLEKSDSKRKSYYDYFTYKQWGVAQSYDVCLNSSLLGIEGCVKVISDIIRSKGWSK